MTLFGKRLAAGTTVLFVIILCIIIAASIPAKAGGAENRLLQSAWDASGAQAGQYSIRAYWKYAGEKSGEAVSRIVGDMARAIGLKTETQQYGTPQENETELHGRSGELNIAICTTYFPDTQNLVLLGAIQTTANENAIRTAEESLQRMLQHEPGADVYRQMTGITRSMTRTEMTGICDNVFKRIKAADIQGSFGENYISTFAYANAEPVYLINGGQRCNIQIAMRQTTTGKTNVLIGIPAVLDNY